LHSQSHEVLARGFEGGKSSRADPLTEDQERGKFRFLAHSAMDTERTEHLMEDILSIETQNALPELA
jgi:hypothetical protein